MFEFSAEVFSQIRQFSFILHFLLPRKATHTTVVRSVKVKTIISRKPLSVSLIDKRVSQPWTSSVKLNIL